MNTVDEMGEPELAGCFAALAVAAGLADEEVELAKAKEEFNTFGQSLFMIAFKRGLREGKCGE